MKVKKNRWILFLALLIALPVSIFAQQRSMPEHVRQLSLKEAIALSRVGNKQVRVARMEESASVADIKYAKVSALPSVALVGDYQRYTSLTLYNDFLGDARVVPKRPSSNGADLSLSSTFNLYSGGRQRFFENEEVIKRDLSRLNTEDIAGYISLQVAAQYLNMVSLNEQKIFIQEQIIRAETRLKDIKALYRNQKITRSDVLRAELSLSAVKLNLEQAENDMQISNQKLDILIDLPDTTKVILADSANMVRPDIDPLLQLVTSTGSNAYAIRKAGESIKIQGERVKAIKSNNSPSLFLFSTYLLSYPNSIFYPPVDQAYSIGFVGFKLQYNISALYQNKNKLSAGKIRLEELELQQQSIRHNAREEASSLLIKYREALDRISVNEKSIEQARVNYKIVSAKYFNQLALLTDLLDADNLYQETRYNLVQAQTNAQFIYYRLLYISGNL